MTDINQPLHKLIKLKKLEKETELLKLRELLPKLKKNEIRKYRQPYYQSIIDDLIDENCVNSANFLQYLIDNPDYELKQSKKHLDILYKHLKNAEIAHKKKQFIDEFNEILELTINYCFIDDNNWQWLGHEFLKSLENCLNNFKKNLKKYQAIYYYIYGRFMFDLNNNDMARDYLEKAKDLSKNTLWNLTKYFSKETVIFIDSCHLLYDIIYQKIREYENTDKKQAIELCQIARKLTNNACNLNRQFEILLINGGLLLTINEQRIESIETFYKALCLAKRLKSPTKMCEAYLQLSSAYFEYGKFTETHDNLQHLKNLSEEHQLIYYQAQAYRHLGIFYLNQNRINEAIPLLESSFDLFNTTKELENYRKEREECRILTSVGYSRLKFVKLTRLIIDPDNLMKLIKWKNQREQFWLSEEIVEEILNDILNIIIT